MSALAKDLFPPRAKSVRQVTRWFHALADETRLQIIDRLRAGEQCVCDLTGLLETGQSRLSFHLKTLKDADIVIDRKQGRWVYYSLNPEVLADMAQFLSVLKTHSDEPSARRCCD